MQNTGKLKVLTFLFLCSLLAAAVTPVFANDLAVFHQGTLAQEMSGTTISLPIIVNQYPPTTIFGIQSSSFTFTNNPNLVTDISPTWARGLTISWAAFEPTQGAQVEESLATFEQNLLRLQSQGLTPIVTITGTPTWAQKIAGYTCGPMRSEYFPAFALFIKRMVLRYSQAPYFIHYWEIWNEPDVDVAHAQPNDTLGCWGDINDANYGGGYYGQMLQAVYPSVKQADPGAQVLVGGLLLDCDPGLSEIDPKPDNPGCKSSRFLNGVLAQGAGSSFDGISFHAYDYYSGILGQYSSRYWGSGGRNGPALLAKANYIKKVLADFQVSGKFLMNTEVALILGEDGITSDDFELTKAGYVGIAYSSAMAAGLRANVWFSLTNDWRYSGLLNNTKEPLPAYYAYQFARQEIGTSVYHRAITNYQGVQGYEFTKGDRLIWVIWAPDGSTLDNLPADPLTIYDALGHPQALTSPIPVTSSPIYIEMPN